MGDRSELSFRAYCSRVPIETMALGRYCSVISYAFPIKGTCDLTEILILCNNIFFHNFTDVNSLDITNFCKTIS